MIIAPQGFERFPILVNPLTVPYQIESAAPPNPPATVEPLDEINRLNPGTDGLSSDWFKEHILADEIRPEAPFGRRWSDRRSIINASLEQSVPFDNSLLSISLTYQSRPEALHVTAAYEKLDMNVDHQRPLKIA
jgi:hypothetical protein